MFQLGWEKGRVQKKLGAMPQSSARTTKIWAQFSAQTTQNLLRVNDHENMGTNLQVFSKHFYIGCLKTQKQQLHFVKKKKKISIIIFCFNSGRARINRAGRKPVRAGCSALRNRPSWNTEMVAHVIMITRSS